MTPLSTRRALLLFGIGSLCAFLLGTSVVRFTWVPYPRFLKPAFDTLRFRSRQKEWLRGKAMAEQWQPAPPGKKGTIRYLPDACWKGYTLVTTADGTSARLIDMEGRVLHEWALPYTEAFPDSTKELPPKRNIFWRCTYLFPNGDLLAMYVGAGFTPWGTGLVKLDRNSSVRWTYAGRTHHDLDVDEQGGIHVLTHKIRKLSEAPIPGHPEFEGEIVDDYAVLLSPEGKEVKRISVTDALATSPFTHLLRPLLREGKPHWDLLHTNAIRMIDSSFAAHHGVADPGDLLLSLRSNSALLLLDPETERIVWIDRAYWRAQHDPDPLPNGNILLFDNMGHMGPGGRSRVIEFNPSTNARDWEYAGTGSEPLFSPTRGTQQRLPNGNVLITDSESGRLIEVTREGAIVWEYINPRRMAGDGRELLPVTLGATRYAPAALPFLNEEKKQ